ncbi:hypothetical protein [Mesoterricola sediminis]|uniref:Uncharacterized protein n=1 Tax=Mesoterricola sediminis TaxID=2927980 RepID=A0AA48GPC5_9BACT|nr:hypothetical protein [Mesoterricola sediminis]BDU75117.1 hypothetical protein METESE_00750 [Mesoterricola sediminis]
MSWLDPQRSQESAEDTLLREELRALLGFQPRNLFETEPTPELIALAEDLRREARRRNRTSRKQTHWMLMAAALPLAIAFGGVGLWGLSQKNKADELATAITRQEAEITRLAGVVKQLGTTSPEASRALNPAPSLLAVKDQPKAKQPKGKELVIPVDNPASVVPQDTQRVKAH